MATTLKNISKTIEMIKGADKAADLAKFGKDFQMKLLALLIKDRIFSFSMLPIMKHEYFTDPYLQSILIIVQHYKEKYQALPIMDNIKIMLEENGEKIAVYEKVLKAVNEMPLDDRDFVIENARNFCFSKHALNENDKVRDALLKGDFAEAQAISTESFKHSGLNTTKILDLHEDYEMVFDEENQHSPIPTPFPTFNENMKGGPGKGNLVIMVAESNFGKSNALIAVSRHANTCGKNVAFFSFEIGGSDMLRRHLAGLNDLRQEEVKNNRKKITDRFAEGLGRFKLIEERATNARISVIKSHLEYLKSTGFFPDMICVDAINQLKLPIGMRYEGDNQKFEYIAEELRDLANEYEIPVYTVMQTNRSGFNSEINDIAAIGKAIEPFQVADVLITFSQTRPMAAENKCMALLLKNRLGKKFICLECYYDPNMCIFQEIAVVNDMLLLDNKAKANLQNTANGVRDRLKKGEFEKKN
jgi:hypothetical protein